MLYIALSISLIYFIILKIKSKPKPFNVYKLSQVIKQEKEFENNFVYLPVTSKDTLWFFDDIDQEDQHEFELYILPVNDELISGIVSKNYNNNLPTTNILNSVFDEDKFLEDIGDLENEN